MKRIGEQKINLSGSLMTIISYRKAVDLDIQFDNGFIAKCKTYFNFRRGKVNSPYCLTVYGVAFIGEGKYSETTHQKIYDKWYRMIGRCYSEKTLKRNPSYTDCTIDNQWLNFQNFAAWFEENYKEGFDLDKDILVKGNKVYSPETCCFVPSELNTVILTSKGRRGKYPIGVTKCRNKYQATMKVYLGTFDTIEEAFQAYKIAKEAYIKELAEKWRGLITEQVYHSLLNWEILITD